MYQTNTKREICCQSFKQIRCALAKAGVLDHLLRVFAKDKCTEKLFRLAWNDFKVQEVVSRFMPYVCPKLDGIADDIREEGNLLYNAKELSKALETYNLSLCAAEQRHGRTSSSLGKAYGNRSALFFDLEKYDICLEDIDRALPHCESDEIKCKLLQRKCKCLALMKHQEACKETLNVLSLLEEELHLPSSLSEDVLENCVREVEKKGPSDIARKFSYLFDFWTTKVPLLDDVNPDLPSYSSSVRLSPNEPQYPALVAVRNIKPGDVVAVHKPFTSVVFSHQKTLFCSHCHDRTLAPIPCPSCSAVMFCSEQCLTAANEKYHKVECPLLALWDANEGKLTLRVLAHYRFHELKEAAEICPTTASAHLESSLRLLDPKMRNLSIYTSDKLKRIFFMSNSVDVVLYCITACLVTKLLIGSTEFFTNMQGTYCAPTEEDKLLLGNVILNQTIVNNIPITYMSIPSKNVVMSGVGCFPDIYNQAQSCVHNLYHVFHGHTMVYRAFDCIDIGSIVTENPYDGYHKMPKAMRRMKFIYFGFQCSCVACTEKWPVWDEFPYEIALKCLFCSALVSDSSLGCTKCEEGSTEDAISGNKERICYVENIKRKIDERFDLQRIIEVIDLNKIMLSIHGEKYAEAEELKEWCLFLRKNLVYPNRLVIAFLLVLFSLISNNEGTFIQEKDILSISSLSL